MEINATITDEQASALAQVSQVTAYEDGRDLINKVAAFALLQAKKRGLIGSIASEKSEDVIDATIAAFDATSDNKVPMPPIRPRP